MLKKLKALFKNDTAGDQKNAPVSLGTDKSGNPIDEDLIIATTVILVELAGADQDIAPEEAVEICNMIEEQFSVKTDRIPQLVEMAIGLRKKKGKIDEFIQEINEKFDQRQKLVVLAMIWKVVIADGEIDKFEQRFATQMKFRFELSDEEAHTARCMAERGQV